MRPPLLFPAPRRIEMIDGIWMPDPQVWQLFADGAKFPRRLRDAALSDDALGAVGIRIANDASLPVEGYQMSINTSGVKIQTASPAGRRYALCTLAQMVSAGANIGERPALPACHIKDWPEFRARGIMLDISRDRVPQLATLETLIDLMVYLKLNQLQLYTEHTFAYEGHRVVWRDASPYTAAEIGRIVAYATVNGIEVVPNQNSYGHMERWLCHPEYRHLAECPDGFHDPWGVFRPEPSTLCPTNPESLQFVADLYRQYLPLFPSRLVNIGGDEPWEHCKGRSRTECERRGSGAIYLEFMQSLQTLAAREGKSVQMWGDIVANHPELVPQLNPDVCLLEWGYEADHPFAERCARYAERQLDFYVCPGTSSWNSFGGRWDNAHANLGNAATQAGRHGAIGYLITDWGDNGHMQQLPISLPGYVHGAALAWNPDQHTATPASDVADDLVIWLAGHLWDDRAIGSALMSLAALPERHGFGLPNASLPFVMLFDYCYPYYRDAYQRYREVDWQPVFDDIARAESELERTQSSTWRDELHMTCTLLDYACRFAQQLLRTDDFDINQIDRTARAQLKTDLPSILDEYRALWHKRARPRGLTRSISRLNGLLDLL